MQTILDTRRKTALPPILEKILPTHLTEEITRLCKASPEELRLHADRCAMLSVSGHTYRTSRVLSERELAQILQAMCAGSLYAHAETINQGYLTLEGGIRVGIGGQAACENGRVIGVNHVTALTVRIPHAVEVPTETLRPLLGTLSSSAGLLFYSPPGVGKTTLLRSLAKELSSPAFGLRTVVVDPRAEFAGTLAGRELDLDVLVGYPREEGIGIAVRSLSAKVILCDEIGSAADADALLGAANCGVPMIATVHARDVREILLRPPLRRLHDACVFGAYVGLSRSHERGLSFRITSRKEADEMGRLP